MPLNTSVPNWKAQSTEQILDEVVHSRFGEAVVQVSIANGRKPIAVKAKR